MDLYKLVTVSEALDLQIKNFRHLTKALKDHPRTESLEELYRDAVGDLFTTFKHTNSVLRQVSANYYNVEVETSDVEDIDEGYLSHSFNLDDLDAIYSDEEGDREEE